MSTLCSLYYHSVPCMRQRPQFCLALCCRPNWILVLPFPGSLPGRRDRFLAYQHCNWHLPHEHKREESRQQLFCGGHNARRVWMRAWSIENLRRHLGHISSPRPGSTRRRTRAFRHCRAPPLQWHQRVVPAPRSQASQTNYVC